MTQHTKKVVIFLVILFFFVIVPHTFAQAPQGFTALAPIPGLTDQSSTSVVNSKTLADFLNNLYKYLIGLAATIAVIEIIWGGLEISTPDSVTKEKLGKERIYNAIFGLVLVLAPVLVFSIINPSILNLSLNLPELATSTSTGPTFATNGGGSAQNPPASDPGSVAAIAAGCTIKGTALKVATCPTQAAAEKFAADCTSGNRGTRFVGHVGTCGTSAGIFAFADTSQSTGFVGLLNTIIGYTYYEPLASTPTSQTNGEDVVKYAKACTDDGGTTCMSATKAPIPIALCAPSSLQPKVGNVSFCWAIELFCSDGNSGVGGCSSSPNFTIIK